MAGAVPVGRVAGELRPPHGLARGATRDRGGVQQANVVTPRRRQARDRGQQPDDLRGQRPHPLVVARLLGQVGKQVPEPGHREAQKAPLARAIEQDLRDGQAHQLDVGDLRTAPGTRPARQDFVGEHVKCGQEGVEIGGHAASSMVDVGESNADLRHPSYVSSTPSPAQPGTESVI